MAKAGVGLMVTLKNRAVVQLYHFETFEHLQDISVASAITRMLEGLLKLFTMLLVSSVVDLMFGGYIFWLFKHLIVTSWL
jgi:hypothetical protein